LLLALLPDRPKHDTVHLLERIDLNFRLQMSIVADALNLTRFKVTGILPTLAVNVSNSKYNGLMRIIYTSIPNFDSKPEAQETLPPKKTTKPPAHVAVKQRRTSNVAAIRLPSNPFVASPTQEYTIEEEPQEKERDLIPKSRKQDPQVELAKAKQKIFEFSFEVGMLQASLSKTDASGIESLLAKAVLEHFTLDFSLTKYEMTVDLLLRYAPKQLVRTSHFWLVRRSVSLNMIDAWGDRSTTLQLLQSATENKERDALVQVHYLKVQPQSPEFTSKVRRHQSEH